MISWPRWKPGDELHAHDLVALEDYLLERSRHENPAFGVADFQHQCLTIEEGDTDAQLKLVAVRGLTPDGQPVRVEPTSALTHPLPPEGGKFEIWVKVNPHVQDANAPKDCGKLILLLDTSNATADAIKPAESGNQLYLGRYSLSDKSVALLQRPVPLCLAGLAPHDENWEKWTNEVPQTIEAVVAAVRKFAEKHPECHSMTSVVLGELLLLAVDWPVEPFTRLAHRLDRARLLTETLFKKQDFPAQPMFQLADTLRAEATGEDLPAQLAAKLRPVFDVLSDNIQNPYPEVGMKVFLEQSGSDCLLFESLGEDERGYRFRARVGSAQMFLRWYGLDNAIDEKRRILETLINRGPPSKEFIWPHDLARSEKTDGFGWVRGFAEERWNSLQALSSGLLTEASITAGINLVQRFEELHNAELCLMDLTLADTLVDENGQVLMLFNDNISPKGDVAWGEPTGWDLLAPELARGTTASYDTDRWTLGVLLFWLFFATHPLRPRADAPEDFDPFSKEPNRVNESIFLFGPECDRTTINQSVLKRWKRQPGFFRDAFRQVLVDGGSDPNARLQESEWIDRLLRLRDSVFHCENAKCRQLAFYERGSTTASDRESKCVMCGSELIVPPRLRLGRNTFVMLRPNGRLFAHHIDNGRAHDFDLTVATVEKNPKSGVWGLVNRSQSDWQILYEHGRPHRLRPGHAWPLDEDHLEATVDFGTAKGTIRARQPLAEILSQDG